MTAPRLHRCPGGCGLQVEYDRLACYPCWWRLPDELRTLVNTTYKQRHQDPQPWHQAVTMAIAWYKANPGQAKP